jgi:hypothetical protein
MRFAFVTRQHHMLPMSGFLLSTSFTLCFYCLTFYKDKINACYRSTQFDVLVNHHVQFLTFFIGMLYNQITTWGYIKTNIYLYIHLSVTQPKNEFVRPLNLFIWNPEYYEYLKTRHTGWMTVSILWQTWSLINMHDWQYALFTNTHMCLHP